MTSKLKHFISSSQGKNGFGWHYDDGLEQHTSEWSKEILNVFFFVYGLKWKSLFVSRSVSCYCKQPSPTIFNGYTRICLNFIQLLQESILNLIDSLTQNQSWTRCRCNRKQMYCISFVRIHYCRILCQFS